MTTASTASRAGFRKLLAIVSAVLLALAFSLQTIPASAAMTEEQLYAQQKELQKKADELKKQLANTNDNLEDSQARLKNMKSQVDNARQQLENINQRLSSLNSQISGKNSEIAAKESAISQKEANIQDASDKLNERLRALSKRGNLSSVQMMLSTEEYAEYLIKSKMLERIAENDQKALNDMEAELTKIKADKSALETDKQALADRKKQEQTLQNEASAKKKEMENLYKAIQAEEKKILAQANNYKAQIEKNKKLLDDIDKEIQKIIDSKSNNNGQYGGGTMFWPVPTVRNISSGFGSRWGTVHRGIDIANGSVPIYGEKIYAAESGTVIYSNYTSTWGGGYGYYCIVDHGLDSKGRRISTLYAHTSKMYARVGDKVTRGKTVLALAGDTGNVTGPHLHFEVRVNGVAVDPIKNGYVSLNK